MLAALTKASTINAKITKRTVDTATPKQRDVFIWDAAIKGFGLKVTPSGKKVYVLQYRFKGRLRRYTIGRHGSPWTPDEARKEALRLLRLTDAGVDPADAKKAEKTSPIVSELAPRFLTDVGTKSKSGTTKQYRRMFKNFILPAFGARRVSDITRADVTRLHNNLGATPYQANLVLQVVSVFFNWAEQQGERSEGSNPIKSIKRFKEHKRERFLGEEEFARLGRALTKAERDKTCSFFAVAAIRLLIFTGARVSEILTLRREWVDLERACLRLPDSKTGQKTIHLNEPALEVLTGLPRVEGNPYVFPGGKGGTHLVDLFRPWKKIREEGGLEDVRLHDLRHSFAAVAAREGVGLHMTSKLLGHAQAAMTERYAHLAAHPLKGANEQVGRKIAAALNVGAGSHGKILRFEKES